MSVLYKGGSVVGEGRSALSVYYYDDANQLLRIGHKSTAGNLSHLVYIHNARGLPETVTEFNHLRHELAEVTFAYDNLGRLIHEVRYDVVQGEDVYDLSYDYDPGGNRTRKTDAVNELEAQYHYDFEDPGEYASANNRLMYHETFDTSGGGQVFESTTYYFYNSSGNVTRVVTNQEGSNEYEATLLSYARNEGAVTFVLGERWDWDGDPAHDPTGYDIAYANEFRYDGTRQRYLNRELDPNELRDNNLLVALNDIWSDYDGDGIYGDFTIEDSTVTVTRSFEAGVGRVDDPFGLAPTTEYYHGDLIGTTRDVSYKGSSTAPAVYTAFGQLIDGTNHRYGYAGAWGYQAHEDFPYLHVGARYYDPGTGRFLQRDPIGIRGGLNTYTYVANAPTWEIDPEGEGGCRGPQPRPLPQPTGGQIQVEVSTGMSSKKGGYIEVKIKAPWEKIKKETKAVSASLACGILNLYAWTRAAVDEAKEALSPPFFYNPIICFVAGTPVLTDLGPRNIEELRNGDSVFSIGPVAAAESYGRVTVLSGGWSSELIVVDLATESLRCTAEHPFWVMQRGWVRAADLSCADTLLSSRGQPVRIVAVRHESLDHPVRVYSVAVNLQHTYFVGHTGVLVHNKAMY